MRGFSAVLLLILVVVVALGAYLMFQRQDLLPQNLVFSPIPQNELTTWKTYTNTKYKYSFDNPGNFVIKLAGGGLSGDEAKVETTSFLMLYSKQTSEQDLTIWVTAGTAGPNTLDEYLDNLEKGKPNTERVIIYSREKTTLGGVEARKYVAQDSLAGGKNMSVVAIHRGIFYRFSLDNSDTKPQNISVFNKILSTFKFTDTPLSAKPQADLPKPVALALEDLAKKINASASQIKIVEMKEVEWGDMSLGCPQPGARYAQVITPGYKVTFEYNQKQYEYHTDKSRRFVTCGKN